MGLPFYGVYGGLGTYYGPPWQWLVALFFGLLLAITLPVYLLIALWQILSKPNTD
jgi:phage shock protein PspC (stress-responsive transcriptional regulator)